MTMKMFRQTRRSTASGCVNARPSASLEGELFEDGISRSPFSLIIKAADFSSRIARLSSAAPWPKKPVRPI
jgi:hypothetical protein